MQRLLSELTIALNLDASKLMEVRIILSKYEIKPVEKQLAISNDSLLQLASMFVVNKKIAGLSEDTLKLYSMILKDFIKTVGKELSSITSTDIRLYLYNYQKLHNISNRTLDMRRSIISSFFAFLVNESYINSNPVSRIEPIKYERKHKKSMTQLDLEKIRNTCKTAREHALVEMLFPTGCRVSELARLNKDDIDFTTKEVKLYGKGSKHRVSFLNAKAEVTLKEYLASRTDNNNALFVGERKPYKRLAKSGIECIIRKLEARTSDISTHVTPHIFRHTTATTAINRGMALSDVSKLLGHSKVETTMEYITSSTELIKNKHQVCII